MKMVHKRGVSLVILILILFGCGAPYPLQRGKPVHDDSRETGDLAKPTENLESAATSTPTPTPTPTSTQEPQPPLQLSRSYFITEIAPLLGAKKVGDGTVKGCAACHGNPAETYEEAILLVELGHPETSLLFNKATGAEGSNHRMIWKPDSPEALKLILWISGRAPID